ncbi:MAG: hypothetical protein U1A78_31865 [Polyangia bacterium]
MFNKTLLLSLTLAGAVMTSAAVRAETCAGASAGSVAGPVAADPSAAPCPTADEVSVRRARAQELAEGQHYREALVELQAAYALRQEPLLLLEQGRMSSRLGQIPEALDAYSRYLAAELNPPAEARREATSEIARLSVWLTPSATQRPLPPGLRAGPSAVPTQPLQPLQPVRYERRANGGLIGGGIAILSAGYTPALLFASIGTGLFSGSGSKSTLRSAVGWSLAVPVAGPFLSALLSLGDTRTFGASWIVPWVLLDGAAQVAGLAMIIGGARSKREVPVLGLKVNVVPYSQPGGGGVAVLGRF